MRKLLALAVMTGLLAIVACDVADTEAPAVSIKSPADGATVNKGDIVIKAVATDNKAVTKVEFSIGGTVMGTDNNGAADTFQYTWTDTAAQVAGHSYELVAKAYDAAENTKSSATITITIAGGGAGPYVNIVYPADGATIGAGAKKIKAIATDANGVAKVVFYDGTATVGEDTIATATGDTFDVDWTATTGVHTLKAVATNDSGAIASDSNTVTVTGGSGPTYHSADITASETWYPVGNPHIITRTITVQSDANSPILTILPGCIVQFQGDYELRTGISEAGAIVAVGKADVDSGILFTTTTSPKTPGSWSSVSVYYRATDATNFAYCTFEYGGSDAGMGTVYADGSKLKLQNCTITQSGSGGVRVLDDVDIATFTGNTISNCGGHAIEMYPDQVSSLGTGNVFTGNTNNDILVHNGDVTKTGEWLNHGAPYVLGGTITVQDATNSPILTIAPGCSLKFSGDYEFRVGISEQGALVAEGTAAAPIVFSTTTSPKTPGSWSSVSVYYRATDATSFAYCTFEYGGSDAGAVYADGSKLELQNCTITQSASGGVKILDDVDIATFAGNTISNCGGHAIEMYPDQVSSLGTGNVYTGNTNNDILLHNGDVTKTGTWSNQEIPYVLSGTVTVQDASNSPVLTIAPGTTVKLQSGVEFRVGISAPGGLVADGTSDTITFTSSAGTPQAGDWAYLSFYYLAMDAQCQLKSCRIEYAGPDYGIIYIDDAKPTITGCDIGHSSAYGIYLSGTEYPVPADLRTNNNIHDFVDGDIREP